MPTSSIVSSVGVALGNIGNARCGIGGGAGRIVLHGVYRAAFPGSVISAGVVLSVRYSVIKGSKRMSLRESGKDTLAICQRHCGCHHRWFEIGHDDGAGEAPRSVRQHCAHLFSVAQVKMPVVGASKG